MDIYPGNEDKLLFQGKSCLNEIRVFDKRNGFRYLILNGVQHGGHIPGHPERLVLPYFKSATAALAFLDGPKDYLFVGLGMGALPTFLRTVQHEASIDVVEIDPDVTQAARDWFGLREDALLRVTHGDGREYVRGTRNRYDAVFLDAYQDVSVPKHLTTLEFMREVRGVLKPGGVAVSNLWGSVVNPLFDSCVKTLQEAFTELYQFKSYTYNYIYIADTKEEEIPAHELLRRAKKVSEKIDLGFNLVEMVRRNYKHIEKDSDDRVKALHD